MLKSTRCVYVRACVRVRVCVCVCVLGARGGAYVRAEIKQVGLGRSG